MSWVPLSSIHIQTTYNVSPIAGIAKRYVANGLESIFGRKKSENFPPQEVCFEFWGNKRTVYEEQLGNDLGQSGGNLLNLFFRIVLPKRNSNGASSVVFTKPYRLQYMRYLRIRAVTGRTC